MMSNRALKTQRFTALQVWWRDWCCYEFNHHELLSVSAAFGHDACSLLLYG
jgi:hypothetical protein